MKKAILGTIIFLALPITAFGAVIYEQPVFSTITENTGTLTYQLTQEQLQNAIIENVTVYVDAVAIGNGTELYIDCGAQNYAYYWEYTTLGVQFAEYPVTSFDISTCDNNIVEFEWGNDDDEDLYGDGAEIYILIEGTIPFQKVGTGFYFFGESNEEDNAIGQTANALESNLGTSISSVWGSVLLALSIPLTFYILQKMAVMFGYAYYKDRPKRRNKLD